MRDVRLGPFDLSRPIGRGGAGVVWAGKHRDSGVPVAVKVMHPHGSRSSGVHVSFMNEVRAVAGLDHPGIVWVFDAGEVDQQTADHSDGELLAGSPYLVMEYASGGTLAEFVPTSWDDVRSMLLGLLDALAHAHARQVVHRDLKPGNVLLGTSADLRPGWKLTDFGIATALEDTQSRSMAEEMIGTLLYMAPEQIRGEWREFGPWTDLYALGALVYRVVGDQRPFGVVRGPGLITAHLTADPDPLAPRVAVPAGFQRWVSRLMAKRPEDRYPSAAHAMRELVQLGGPSAVVVSKLEDDSTAELEGPTELVLAPAVGWRSVSRVPEDWRTGEVALPPPGVGLALFVLRTLPFVGRYDERDRLWERFRAVVARGRSEVVVIEGAPGIGKTRLARWLGESAHALAGVPYLLGDARVGESATDALSRPFRRFFRTIRLDTGQRIERLRRFLGSTRDDAVEAAAAFTADGSEEQAALGPEARFTTARLLLEHLAGPSHGVVLVIDDAHRSPDVLRFGAYLLRTQRVRPIPVLMVVVTDPAPDAEAAGSLAELLAEPGATEFEIGPLPRAAHERLVGSMLPFEPSLAERVVDRTVGHPQHAVSVVRSWVSAHELVAVDGVYVRVGGDADIPPMAEVWRGHLRRLFEDLPQARPVLERAAVFGPAVEEEEWQRATDDPQGTYAAAGRVNFRPETARLRAQLRERLQGDRLVEDSETGLVFVVESFRQALIALAAEGGTLGEHHRACARVLALRPPAHRCDERVGRHLVAGDCPAQAVAHWVDAWRQRLRSGGERAAYPLLAEVEDALRRARIPVTDRRWAELAVRRAELACRLERSTDARRAAADAEKRARIGGWPQLQARAAIVLAEVRLRAGDADEADAALARADELLAGLDAPDLAGSVATLRAACARAVGDFSVAAGQVERATAALAAAELDPSPSRAELAERWTTLGQWAERDADLDRASRCHERARALHLRDHATSRVARSSLALAGVVRSRGDVDGARRWFVDALDRFREAGHPAALDAALGLARIELARRDWVEAHRLATEVLGRSEAGPEERDGAANAVMVAAAAGMRDWPLFDLHLGRVGPAGAEAAWCLRIAEANADAAGQDARARKASAAARAESGG